MHRVMVKKTPIKPNKTIIPLIIKCKTKLKTSSIIKTQIKFSENHRWIKRSGRKTEY